MITKSLEAGSRLEGPDRSPVASNESTEKAFKSLSTGGLVIVGLFAQTGVPMHTTESGLQLLGQDNGDVTRLEVSGAHNVLFTRIRGSNGDRQVVESQYLADPGVLAVNEGVRLIQPVKYRSYHLDEKGMRRIGGIEERIKVVTVGGTGGLEVDIVDPKAAGLPKDLRDVQAFAKSLRPRIVELNPGEVLNLTDLNQGVREFTDSLR